MPSTVPFPFHWLLKRHRTKKLFRNIQDGKLEEVQKLLLLVFPTDCFDSASGRTPLHVAAEFGRTQIVKQLLDLKVRVDALDSSHRTPLHRASSYGHLEVIRLLLKEGADPNIKNQTGRTPLAEAAVEWNYEAMKLLLEGGALPNVAVAGGSLLHWNLPIHIMQLLLKYGADVHKMNLHKETPLFCACHRNRVDLVKLFIQRGAKVNKSNFWGVTPLEEAAQKGHWEVVKTLVEAGASVHKNSLMSAVNMACVVDKQTPKWLTIQEQVRLGGNKPGKMVVYLLEKGAKCEKILRKTFKKEDKQAFLMLAEMVSDLMFKEACLKD